MTMPRPYTVLVLLLFASNASLAAGDATRGAPAFRACAACHSLNAGDHRTGPSLAKVYGRRAGAADGFQRYSAALRKSGVAWNDKALDDWLRDPVAFIPGNAMAFRGLPETFVIDRQGRIAYKQIGPLNPDVLEKTILPLIRKLRQ